ncbi:DMT family transporter [Catelliglobosispora koreensis]|uniref:DMT family transporter n=1 Tax=Catelliglobosispora koreensis TaxID=129052 RepID=UPI00036ACC69|nr:EamA family transporter [Catelliglobosispora koreensis]
MSTSHRSGLALAFAAAAISGVAVYLNGFAVKVARDATIYTTAKNLIAGLVIVGFVMATRSAKPVRGGKQLATLGLVALIGGSIPFVLFFEGLARASSVHAAFIHKTLFLWVAVLAIPLLGERLRPVHGLAAAMLVGGLFVLEGGLTGFSIATGEVLIFAATLLWSAETVVVKRLLHDVAPATVALARMAVGSLALVAWVIVTGRWHALVALPVQGWLWAAATGVILSCYVLTWFTALERAQALDVTAILVAGAVLTAVLRGGYVTVTAATGLTLIAVGAVITAFAAVQSRQPELT